MAGCGKIFGSCAVCCSTGQHDHHHVSHRQQDHMLTSHAPNPSLPTHDHKAHKATDHKKHHHVSKPHGKQEAPKSGLETNDKFSDYINRAKVMIRSVTNVHGGNRSASNSKADGVHDTKNDDHTKDTFSEYIKRVKVKIRKTYSTGSRKSFKGEHVGETG